LTTPQLRANLCAIDAGEEAKKYNVTRSSNMCSESAAKGGKGARWARFFEDESEASKEALEMLRKSDLCFVVFRNRGRVGPELKLGKRVARGLEEIRTLVAEGAA
jgi:hypothetical protein